MAGDAIARVMAELDAFQAQQIIGLALEVRAQFIFASRVDTGWGRANMQAAVGAPPGAEAGQSEAAAIRALVGYTTDRGPVYVSNRVPYAGLQGRGRGVLTIEEAGEAIAAAIAVRTGVKS